MTSKVGINNEHNFEKFLGVNLVKNDKTRETEEFGFKEIIENIYYYYIINNFNYNYELSK